MFENLKLTTRTAGGARGDPQWGKMTFKEVGECRRWLNALKLLLQEGGPRALLEEFFLPEKVNEILNYSTF
jgi:hypothetical protein